MQPYELSINEAAAKIRSKDLSLIEYVESLLNRTASLEPQLNAWVTLDQDTLLREARTAQNTVDSGQLLGPLHGIPIGLKDIFCTAGIKTTACSRLYADYIPQDDAASVTGLKHAGALIMGKLVTTAYAASDPSPTINPWNHELTPGGSSSGSAVAVATQMCPAALGSQTVGSTLRPAAYNGIVGLKPTFGRISLRGVIPLSYSLDTVGILTRTVGDAGLLFNAMAGHDTDDLVSAFQPVVDYYPPSKRSKDLPRIGIVKDFFYAHASQEVQDHTNRVIDTLSNEGFQITEVRGGLDLAEQVEATSTTFNVEVAAVHGDDYRRDPSLYPPMIQGVIEKGNITPATEYILAQRVRTHFREQIRQVFSSFDVLLCPSTPAQPPRRDGGTTGPPIFQGLWTSAGLPALSIPSGLDSDGSPFGIQLVAPWFEEVKLLTVGEWGETILGRMSPPPVDSSP